MLSLFWYLGHLGVTLGPKGVFLSRFPTKNQSKIGFVLEVFFVKIGITFYIFCWEPSQIIFFYFWLLNGYQFGGKMYGQWSPTRFFGKRPTCDPTGKYNIQLKVGPLKMNLKSIKQVMKKQVESKSHF